MDSGLIFLRHVCGAMEGRHPEGMRTSRNVRCSGLRMGVGKSAPIGSRSGANSIYDLDDAGRMSKKSF